MTDHSAAVATAKRVKAYVEALKRPHAGHRSTEVLLADAVLEMAEDIEALSAVIKKIDTFECGCDCPQCRACETKARHERYSALPPAVIRIPPHESLVPKEET